MMTAAVTGRMSGATLVSPSGLAAEPSWGGVVRR
jgi:hypothetical protein